MEVERLREYPRDCSFTISESREFILSASYNHEQKEGKGVIPPHPFGVNPSVQLHRYTAVSL